MVKINYVGKTLLIEKDEKKILVIGDLHLGYLEKLRNSGVLILGNSFDDVLNELDLIFEKVGNVFLDKKEWEIGRKLWSFGWKFIVLIIVDIGLNYLFMFLGSLVF